MSWSLHIVLVFVAIFWIGYYLINWFRVVAFFNSEKLEPLNSSIENLEIICTFRNEKNILESFLNNCELIIKGLNLKITLVDDHSEDNSTQIIESHPIFNNNSFKLIDVPQHIQGKKNSLNWAIENSTSKIILTTDADCILSQSSILNQYSVLIQKNADLVLGLITFTGGDSVIESYQKIENSALVALSTYHAHSGNITMGNAANMIFRRSVFLKTQPFRDNFHVSGGDDIFMIRAFQKNGYRVAYSNNLKSQVTTMVLTTWRETWHQRIRWAQKSKYQEFGSTQKSQILFVLFLIYLWGISILCLLNHMYAVLFGMWCFKICGEFIFIQRLFTKLDQNIPSYWQIFISSLLQFTWIPAIALVQFFVPVKWKGRTS